MDDPMVAIVTGANRGIGEAVIQTLVKSFPDPLIIYATSRKGQDLALQTPSNIQIRHSALDIANTTSIETFADKIKEAHGVVDVLINNAAGHDADKSYTPEVVKMVLNTNFRGTLHMCQAFMPLLTQGKRGRIVNVSSTDSSLGKYSKEIQQRFHNPKMTLQDLEAMVQEYQTLVGNRTESQSGWPKSAYAVSKASTNALTAVLARENPGVTINCCCPGWVDTDMGSIAGSRPPKTPEDGAKIPVRLGFGDIGSVTGRYWGNPSVADIDDGQVMDW